MKLRDTLRHDINNQLEIIFANTELLELASLSLKDRHRVEQIQRAIEKIQQLLNESENREPEALSGT